MRVGCRSKNECGRHQWDGLRSKAVAAEFDAEYVRVRAERPVVVPSCWESLADEEAEKVASELHAQMQQVAERGNSPAVPLPSPLTI